MRSAYVEDIYYDDANVRVTNLNVYYGGNSRALKSIRSARLGVFRPVDDTRNSLIGSGIMLLGIILMLIFYTKGIYSLDDPFTWILMGYALIGIINLVQGVRNIMSLQRSDEKLPRGEVYGVVLKEQFFEVTTAVSVDRAYIEHVVSTVQSFLNNKTNRKQLPGYAPTGDSERKPVIAGGTLVIGNTRYDLDEIQSAKADTIRITNGFWTTQSQSVGFALLCTGLYTVRWGLYLVAVPAILLYLGVSAISFYVSGSRAALAHVVTVKGTFGSAIIYASTVEREVDDLVTAIRTGMKGSLKATGQGAHE